MPTAICAGPTPSDRRSKRGRYAAGAPFAFAVTLCGEHLGYLPYLALGAEGMGAGGIGRKEIQHTAQQGEH